MSSNITFTVTDPLNMPFYSAAGYGPASSLTANSTWDPSYSKNAGNNVTSYQLQVTFQSPATINTFSYRANGDGTHDSPSLTIYDNTNKNTVGTFILRTNSQGYLNVV